MSENTKPEAAAAKPPRDLRQELTTKLVQSLEQGQIPWNKPWVGQGLPRNMETGREYRGGNRLMLLLEQADRGYVDPRYGTVKQINALGGRVKKGERGMPVELWKEQPFYERKDITVTLNDMRVKVFAEKNGMAQIGMPTDKEDTLRVKTGDLRVQERTKDGQQDLSWADARKLDAWTARVHTVFNVAQCEGLKIEPLAPAPNFDRVARGETIKAAMARDGLSYAEHPQHAFYSPRRDEVSLPPRGAFNSEPGKDDGAARYYGTLLHEIGHATGAAHRLNREGITGGHRFGSEGYAKEELRAELFSMFMAAETGIPHDEEQHKAYIQSWAKVLKNDKNEIFRAAAEASKAVDYVLGKEQSLLITQEKQASAKAAELAEQALDAKQSASNLGKYFQQIEDDLDRQVNDILDHAEQPTKQPLRELRRESIDNLNPDLRLGVEAYSFLAVDKGTGAYAFDEFADIINARYDSPQARAIADAFRAVPDGVLTVNANRTVSIDLPALRDQVPQQELAPRTPTLREALEEDGWKFKALTGSYEKTFVMTKDKSRGGEFTYGKSEVERILIAKTAAQGLIIESGWDDIPVPGTAGVAPREAARLLDAAAKERLATEHAHLRVVAVRGANEPARPQSGEQEQARHKAPHEMTFAEFSAVAKPVKLGPNHGRQWEVFNGKESLGFADGPTEEGALRQVHKREVNNALYGNQPDAPAYLHTSMPPRHVLAEYPDLQKQFAGVIEARQPAAILAPEPMQQQGRFKSVEIDAPATWGSALVNRDESGLGQSEAACVKDWVANQGIGWPVSMSDQTFMGRHEGLLTEMATYTFLVPEKDIGLSGAGGKQPTTPEITKPSAYDEAIQNFVLLIFT